MQCNELKPIQVIYILYCLPALLPSWIAHETMEYYPIQMCSFYTPIAFNLMILVFAFWIICLKQLSYYQPLLFLTLNHERLAVILNALTIVIVLVTFGVEEMNAGHICFPQASEMILSLEANVNASLSLELLNRNLTVFDNQTKETRIVSIVLKISIFFCVMLVLVPSILRGLKVSKTFFMNIKVNNKINASSLSLIEMGNMNVSFR